MAIGIGSKKQFKCQLCGAFHTYEVVKFSEAMQSYLAEAHCPAINGKVTQSFRTCL